MAISSARMQLDDYLSRYHPDFRRKDRAQWARVYIAGLLANIARKTVEGIARAVPQPMDLEAEDTRQGLQNFIQESPWDEQLIWQRYRQELWQALPEGGVLVVEDLSIAKQGRSSVGVHRQFCSDQGKKLNCQVVPAVFLVAGALVAPLAMRLYLPGAWQAAPDRLEASKVPPEYRQACPKYQVALELLAQVRDESDRPLPVHAGDSYLRHDGFCTGVKALGYELYAQPGAPLQDRVQRLVQELKERFGLDHFEGRTWRGLHHHLCLVTLSYGYALLNEA